MLQNAAEARSSFLGGLNIAVLVDRYLSTLSTEHKRKIAAYLQVNRNCEAAKPVQVFTCARGGATSVRADLRTMFINIRPLN